MTDATKTRSQSIASLMASTLVALACNGSAGKVMAAQPPEGISKVVSYGDLDLDWRSCLGDSPAFAGAQVNKPTAPH